MLQRRSLRYSGGRLALFAVFLQLVLSFGHIHPSDIFPFGHAVAQGQGVAQLVTADHGSPAGQNETGAGGEACAICANMALAASLVLPDPIGIAPPAAAIPTRVAAPVALLIAAAPHLLFQTRAPPSA
jgi:hypothetical protein